MIMIVLSNFVKSLMKLTIFIFCLVVIAVYEMISKDKGLLIFIYDLSFS